MIILNDNVYAAQYKGYSKDTHSGANKDENFNHIRVLQNRS